jgi:hypothetical protein
MGDSHVLLYRARDRVEATLLAHALDNASIRADLAGGNSQMMYGEVGATEALGTDLWVRREDFERGRKVIQDYHAHVSPATGAAWTCSTCGETNEPGFDICWSCRSARAPDHLS